MLTLAIRNAEILDGTGAPAFHGDLGVQGDRIVAIGKVEDQAVTEIDARGRTLSPGFIDIHTHYDPQLCWDRNATPSPEHGVTSVVMGNCSISLAPIKPADRERAIHLFGSVEDMEGRLLEETVPFSWESIPDYLSYLRKGIGPNVGSLIGHSMLRLYVMGAAAQTRAATDSEIDMMAGILREGIQDGAFGISFTFNHLDEHGNKLPCHYADHRERQALVQVLVDAGRGIVELAPNFFRGDPDLPFIDRWAQLALETGVTTSFSPFLVMPPFPGRERELVAWLDSWRAKGALVYAQTQVRPLDMTVQLSKGSGLLSKGAAWRDSFELTVEDRMARYRNPEARTKLVAEGERMKSALKVLTIKRGRTTATTALEGRFLTDIAEERGQTFTEALIDISLDDELETEFNLSGYLHGEETEVAALLKHPGVQIGAGDAGAHISQFAGVGDTSYLLERFVRERGDLTLEDAVRRITSELAETWGIKDRGVLKPGAFADLTIFDPATIARGEEIWVEDVPGNQGRYIRRPKGVEKTIVNGEILVSDAAYTEAQPGRLL